jgi:hypothetical protein
MHTRHFHALLRLRSSYPGTSIRTARSRHTESERGARTGSRSHAIATATVCGHMRHNGNVMLVFKPIPTCLFKPIPTCHMTT